MPILEKMELTREKKKEHISKCEFHRGTKNGDCPTVSKEEAEKLQ
jgi:hypothetical protein